MHDSSISATGGFPAACFTDPAPLNAGIDAGDMSGDYHRPLSDFNIINIMLPTKYYPPLRVSLHGRFTHRRFKAE